MDIKIQTKITVLLEKIQYLNAGIQQQGGIASKVDKDLLTNYVRELYEVVLSLPIPEAQPYYGQQPAYPQQPQQPYAATSPNGFYLPNASPIGNQPSAPAQQPAYVPPPSHQAVPQPAVNGNGSYNGSQNGAQTNGTPQPQPMQQPIPSASAFAFANGKRTLSDSIRIKTAETEKPTLNEQFKKDDNHLAGQMQLSPIKDLKTFIGLNKRFSYINYLFGNDANLYDEAVEKLNTTGSLQSALDYLNNHLKPKLKWSDENEMVEEFYTLVQRRYVA